MMILWFQFDVFNDENFSEIEVHDHLCTKTNNHVIMEMRICDILGVFGTDRIYFLELHKQDLEFGT